MKRIVLPILVCCSMSSALAQDSNSAPPTDMDQGVSLMQQGATLLLRGLMANMEPTMQDMGRAIAQMQPALKDLLAMMGDVTKYHAPELLDNGDIIIRRKTPAELAAEAPAIDL